MQQRIIDTHIHVWNFTKAKYSWLDGNDTILNRNYELDEIEDERHDAGVTDGVLVQAANNFDDTDWMLEVASTRNWIRGVVGWMPLMYPDNTEVALQQYQQNPCFKGVRHLIHDETDPKWLLQEAVLESLKILAHRNIPFDVVGVLPAHIETVLELAGKIPSLRMVFDHLNQPPAGGGKAYGVWADLMKEAAQHPQLHAKISGLGTTTKKPDWSGNDIRPCVAFVLEHFGEDRCFCGGDWPVSLLAGTYSDTWRRYQEVIDELTDQSVRSRIYYSNAAQFYQL